jgi:DNA-binding LacI/PurR family transcriptional regulator
MPNIIDVAKKAKVGIATVSRVINNSGYVKKETRDRVEQVIREIGYVHNEIARSMTLQKNKIVAFLLPNSTHLFFGELLFNVEKELYDRGYKLMVCNSSEQLEKEIAYIDMLKNNRVDAIVMLTNNDIEPFLNESLKIITIDRRLKGVPYVTSDNYMGGRLAARHLIASGCKHMMFIGDDAQGEYTSIETEVSKRRFGFFDELKAHGFTDTLNIEYPLGNYIFIPPYVHDIIRDHPEIDGIFTISDAVAAEVVLNIERSKRRVPEDVKVIGYDGGRSFLNLGKKITSIGQSPEKIAVKIGELIQNYYDKKPLENQVVPVEFFHGETA